MCIYLCIHVHTCKRMFMYVCILYKYICTYLYIHVQVCKYVYMYVHKDTYVHIYLSFPVSLSLCISGNTTRFDGLRGVWARPLLFADEFSMQKSLSKRCNTLTRVLDRRKPPPSLKLFAAPPRGAFQICLPES